MLVIDTDTHSYAVRFHHPKDPVSAAKMGTDCHILVGLAGARPSEMTLISKGEARIARHKQTNALLDPFDPRKGRKLSFGRALHEAIPRGEVSLRRRFWKEFLTASGKSELAETISGD